MEERVKRVITPRGINFTTMRPNETIRELLDGSERQRSKTGFKNINGDRDAPGEMLYGSLTKILMWGGGIAVNQALEIEQLKMIYEQATR